jgi:hypothetical protein
VPKIQIEKSKNLPLINADQRGSEEIATNAEIPKNPKE